jgi:hypothetical protein
MSKKERIERPLQIIKTTVTPVSADLKAKVATAFQAFVNAIKDKHLN